MKNTSEENIQLKLPVKIGYTVLEAFLKEKLIGENIKKEDNGKTTNYARILDVALAQSLEPDFDLAVDLKFKTLTSIFRGREGSILLDASLAFDPAEQVVSVRDYKFDIDSRSWLLNNSLEALVNSFLYDKIRTKMTFDFRPLIGKQLQSLNEKLEDGLEASEGIFLSGFLTDFRITDILPGEEVLLVLVELDASGLIDVRKINF